MKKLSHLQIITKALEQSIRRVSKPRYFNFCKSVFTVVAVGYLAFQIPCHLLGNHRGTL